MVRVIYIIMDIVRNCFRPLQIGRKNMLTALMQMHTVQDESPMEMQIIFTMIELFGIILEKHKQDKSSADK